MLGRSRRRYGPLEYSSNVRGESLNYYSSSDASPSLSDRSSLDDADSDSEIEEIPRFNERNRNRTYSFRSNNGPAEAIKPVPPVAGEHSRRNHFHRSSSSSSSSFSSSRSLSRSRSVLTESYPSLSYSTLDLIREHLGVPVNRKHAIDYWAAHHLMSVCSIKSRHGDLDIDVAISNHPIYRNFKDADLTRDFARVQEYATQNCGLDALVATHTLTARRIAGLPPPFGVNFAFTESDLFSGSLSGTAQQWIHGQSNRLSIDNIRVSCLHLPHRWRVNPGWQKLMLGLPQIDAPGKSLITTLLDFTKLEYDSSHVSVRKLNPFVRRAMTFNEDSEEAIHTWVLFLNMPYLSIGNAGSVSPTNGHFVQGQPLMQYLYPFETMQVLGDNHQALVKAGYLPSNRSIHVSSFCATTLCSGLPRASDLDSIEQAPARSTGCLVTLCSKMFESLQEPYLSSTGSGQSSGSYAFAQARQVHILMSVDPSFAFTFPLLICASYFALASLVSDAMKQHFGRRLRTGYSLQVEDCEINQMNWTHLCSQNKGTVEIRVIWTEASRALSRSSSDSSMESSADEGGNKVDGISTPLTKSSATNNHYKAARKTVELDRNSKDLADLGLKIVPFFTWVNEVRDSAEHVPTELRPGFSLSRRERTERARYKSRRYYSSSSGDRSHRVFGTLGPLRHFKSGPRTNAIVSSMDTILGQLEKYFRLNSASGSSKRSSHHLTSRQTAAHFYKSHRLATDFTSVKEIAAAAEKCSSHAILGLDPAKPTWYVLLKDLLEDLDLVMNAFCPVGVKHPLLHIVGSICRSMLNDIKVIDESLGETKATTSGPNSPGAVGDDNDNSTTGNGAPFDGGAILFDRARLEVVEGSHHLPDILVIDCAYCRGQRKKIVFNSWGEAINHLELWHAPQIASENLTRQDLARFVVSKGQYLQLSATARIHEALMAVVSNLHDIVNTVRQIQAGMSVEKASPSCVFVIPKPLFETFFCLIIGLVWMGFTISITKDIWLGISDKRKWNSERQIAKLLERSVKFFKQTRSNIKSAKLTLKTLNLPPGHSAYDYYDDVGVAYLLCVTAGGLCDKIGSKDSLELLQAYEDYGRRLNYQVKKNPRRRIRNELVQCREEIATILSVYHDQRTTMNQLRRFLHHRSFDNAPADRQFKFRLERHALSVFDAKAREREQFCKDLLAQFGRIETELMRAVEIDQDDHGKAILAFTIVTVIFLPLSFATSFLGMNTTDIRNTDSTQWLFWAVALPLTFLTVAAAVAIGYYGDGLRDGASKLVWSLVPWSNRRPANDVSIGRFFQDGESIPRKRSRWKSTRAEKQSV